MKKIITLSLAVLMLCACLAGCGASVDITGSWETVHYYDADGVLAQLEALEFYQEEIALVDPATMGFCEVMELNEDLTYSMRCDAAKSRDLSAEFYEGVFAAFYENREQLQGLYEEDFVSMSEEEFKNFYAALYGASSFEELMELIVGTVEDYAYLEESAETGTYRISINRIYFTAEGTTEEEYVSFRTGDDGSMTVEFTDSTVVYTKAE